MKYTYETRVVNMNTDREVDIPASAVGVTIERDWANKTITVHYLMEKRPGRKS